MRRDVSLLDDSDASEIIALVTGAGNKASPTKVLCSNQPVDRACEGGVVTPKAQAQYRFFGLADTQTETQIIPDEDVDMDKGPTKQQDSLKTPAQAVSRHAKSRNHKEQSPLQRRLPPSPTRARTDFVHGPPSRTRPRTNRTTYHQETQDSFVGAQQRDSSPPPESDEPDQFNVPLSQLEDIALEREEAARMRKQNLQERRKASGGAGGGRYTPPSSPARQPLRDSPEGRVLVEATPSPDDSLEDMASGSGAQPREDPSSSPPNQAALYADFGIVPRPLDASQESRFSEDLRILTGDNGDDGSNAGVSQESLTVTATQPATQLDDYINQNTIYPLLRQLFRQNEHAALKAAANKVMTFVNPENPGRYMDHIGPVFEMAKELGVYAKWREVAIAEVEAMRRTSQRSEVSQSVSSSPAPVQRWAQAVAHAAVEPPSFSTDYQETQLIGDTQLVNPTGGEETQPSNEEDYAPRKRVFPPRRTFPQNPAPPPAAATYDAMDVVPDSEPMREPPSITLTPIASSSTRLSPIKKQFQPAVVDSHPDSGDIVPDSLEVDDEPDEAPLAKVAPLLNKGKAVAREGSPAIMPPPKILVAPSSKGKGKQKVTTVDVLSAPSQFTTHANVAGLGSWDTEVIPSSVPEQDGVISTEPAKDLAPPPPLPTTKPKAKAKTRNTRSAARDQVAVASSSKQALDVQRDSLTPLADTEENVSTEEDEGEEYQEPVKEEKGTKKRKRAAPASKPKSTARTTKTAAKGAKRIKKESPPATRAKSLRASVPASSTKSECAPTRVYGLWKNDGHYYPGTLHSVRGPSKYCIKFDDNTEAVLTLEQLRRAELKVGDEVVVPSKNSKTYEVVNVDDQYTSALVTLRLRGVDSEFPISDICVHMKTINSTWNDRRIKAEGLVTKVKQPAPSPSNITLNSTVRVKSEALTGLGIVITMGPSTKTEVTKEDIAKIVLSGRGVVVDDWSNVVDLAGTYEENNQRWVITQDQVQWIGDCDTISKIFLVSNEANEKPRYLMALALGVPCISYKWLKACIEEDAEIEWSPYLLPQGFVESLEAHVSQFVDLFWCASKEHLRKIAANKVPPKIMMEKSILCLGREFIPIHGKILMCMGASRVEAVKDLRFASQGATEYDYVVLKEGAEFDDDLEGATVIDTQWIKGSLVAGRPLDLPSWS
ncbi:hypothetical protein ONZ45_g15719 [Pleurotus djamor]|nr:hypothetical protein ONZ45_g15719 [Pleurotus djamor]